MAKTSAKRKPSQGSKNAKAVQAVIDRQEDEKMDVKQLTSQQQADLDAITNISGKIRYLDGQGISRGHIAQMLGKRYQHVRNVLENPLKRKKVVKA